MAGSQTSVSWPSGAATASSLGDGHAAGAEGHPGPVLLVARRRQAGLVAHRLELGRGEPAQDVLDLDAPTERSPVAPSTTAVPATLTSSCTGVSSPKRARVSPSGATDCTTTTLSSGRMTASSRSGRSTRPAGGALGCRADQASGWASSSPMRASTSAVAGSAGAAWRADGDVELDVDDEEAEAAAGGGEPRLGPLQVGGQLHAEQLLVAGVDAHAGGDVGDEEERGELKEHVELEPAPRHVGDAEELGRGLELEAAAELDAVGRDREVGGDGRGHPLADLDLGPHPAQRLEDGGDVGGGLEAGVEAADAQDEVGVLDDAEVQAASPLSSMTPSSRES